jgi:hypothetical protein
MTLPVQKVNPQGLLGAPQSDTWTRVGLGLTVGRGVRTGGFVAVLVVVARAVGGLTLIVLVGCAGTVRLGPAELGTGEAARVGAEIESDGDVSAARREGEGLDGVRVAEDTVEIGAPSVVTVPVVPDVSPATTEIASRLTTAAATP